MRIVISIPMEKNRDSHFCKNRAALALYIYIYIYIYIAKSIGSTPLTPNERFDYFSNFHEYKS